MKFPCENCIKYPMCISKKTIHCDDFIEYLFDYEGAIIEEMKRVFPEAQDVLYDNEGYYKIVKIAED